MSDIDRLQEEVKRLRKLASLLTVRQVIQAGDEYIEAAGLNPWCMNEGLATGDERLNLESL
jgi:predicted translin family RNA/ssDNA-binding protein